MNASPPSPASPHRWRSRPWLFFGLCGFLLFNLFSEAQALVDFINLNFGQGHPAMDPMIRHFFIHLGFVSLSLSLVAFRQSLALYPLAIGGATKVVLAYLLAYQGLQKITQLHALDFSVCYLLCLQDFCHALGYLIATWYLLRSRKVRRWLHR